MNLYAEHARAIAQVGDEYHLASIDGSKVLMKAELMLAPKLEDGRVAWKYADKKSKILVKFTSEEHDSWTLDWERRTGRCRQCSHSHPGKERIGWGVSTGDLFQTCPRCNGTGKSNHQPVEAAG